MEGSISFNSLFRRACIKCDNETPPCPTDCRKDQVCSLVPPTCNACQKMICVSSDAAPTPVSTSLPSSSSASNVGAIAGGVAGGVAVIALITYLVWRFCIKTQRQQYEQENWAVEEPEEPTASEKDFAMRRDTRASTHTVGSVASSVLTRASNIIQIAYIPGVTNRSAPSTPGLLVPPVPPIPIALSSTANTPRYEQEHFFMPGDLRDSTYSGYSDRTSYARNSVASTIYGKNAVVSPVPAQTVIRARAAVVSVKSNGQGGELTPPVPIVDFGRYGNNAPPSPAFSVGSTFLNSASAATNLKPQIVRVGSQKKKKSMSAEEAAQSQSLLSRDSNAITIIDDTPTLEQGPFSNKLAIRRQSSGTLGALTEEPTPVQPRKSEEKDDKDNKDNKDNKEDKDGEKETTPFGDENEVKEP